MGHRPNVDPGEEPTKDFKGNHLTDGSGYSGNCVREGKERKCNPGKR